MWGRRKKHTLKIELFRSGNLIVVPIAAPLTLFVFAIIPANWRAVFRALRIHPADLKKIWLRKYSHWP
ncbi:MAG: hypothetical protein COB37_03165 [Kordiimonadales bacterium]|nr:MAG: hypothetical protein COB37_03165 [Kordiimonadales bacterium]